MFGKKQIALFLQNVQQLIQNYENNIIQPSPQFRDEPILPPSQFRDDAPIPAARTKKQSPVAAPRANYRTEKGSEGIYKIIWAIFWVPYRPTCSAAENEVCYWEKVSYHSSTDERFLICWDSVQLLFKLPFFLVRSLSSLHRLLEIFSLHLLSMTQV